MDSAHAVSYINIKTRLPPLGVVGWPVLPGLGRLSQEDCWGWLVSQLSQIGEL